MWRSHTRPLWHVAIPAYVWCTRGTGISFWDILLAAGRPGLAGVAAASVAFGVQFYFGHLMTPVFRLAVGNTILFGLYFGLLLTIMGQRTVYLDLIRGLRKAPSIEATAVVSA